MAFSTKFLIGKSRWRIRCFVVHMLDVSAMTTDGALLRPTTVAGKFIDTTRRPVATRGVSGDGRRQRQRSAFARVRSTRGQTTLAWYRPRGTFNGRSARLYRSTARNCVRLRPANVDKENDNSIVIKKKKMYYVIYGVCVFFFVYKNKYCDGRKFVFPFMTGTFRTLDRIVVPVRFRFLPLPTSFR